MSKNTKTIPKETIVLSTYCKSALVLGCLGYGLDTPIAEIPAIPTLYPTEAPSPLSKRPQP